MGDKTGFHGPVTFISKLTSHRIDPLFSHSSEAASSLNVCVAEIGETPFSRSRSLLCLLWIKSKEDY